MMSSALGLILPASRLSVLCCCWTIHHSHGTTYQMLSDILHYWPRSNIYLRLKIFWQCFSVQWGLVTLYCTLELTLSHLRRVHIVGYLTLHYDKNQYLFYRKFTKQFLNNRTKIKTRNLSCGWETRAMRQHSKFTLKKFIETIMMMMMIFSFTSHRNEHSVHLLWLHTAWNSVFCEFRIRITSS